MKPTAKTRPVSEFQQSGFLSDAAQKEAASFREALSGWVVLYFSLNRFAQELLGRMEVNNRNAAHLLVFSGFYRVLTSFQGVFLLVERGMDMESKVLLRSITDTTLVVTAASKNVDFVKRYIRADEDSRLKLMKRTLAVKDVSSFLPPEQITQFRNEVAKLEAEKKAAGKNWTSVMRISDIAEEAGLADVYKQHFSYLSLFTHPTPLGMAQFLVTDDKGGVTHFRTGRYDVDAEANLRVAIVMLLQTMGAASKVFKLRVEHRLSEFERELETVIAASNTQKLSETA
jgi:hypothetical protein